MTVPVMELRWGRVGYLASVVFPTFEHVHGVTEFPIRPVKCGSASASQIGMGVAPGCSDHFSGPCDEAPLHT
jgi:hypothetical protein